MSYHVPTVWAYTIGLVAGGFIELNSFLTAHQHIIDHYRRFTHVKGAANALH